MLSKFKKEYIDLEATTKPYMYKYNKWWFVLKNEQGYLIDITCTTKQYYKIYKQKGGELSFDDFLVLAKAGEINLNKISD